MPQHRTATREEWLTDRNELLEREKEHTRRNDELARQRRELPWVRIEKEYAFESEDGERTLADLFDGRSQLLVYNFMFGPAYEAGCPACSSIGDGFDAVIPHLGARDVSLTAISRAPLERLLAFRERMGWGFPWVSSADTAFNFDFQASQSDEAAQQIVDSADDLGPVPELGAACGTDAAGYLTEAPVLNAFALEDGEVFHTYSATARGGEFMMGYYGFLDRAPLGRNEGDPPELWLRRHDEY